MTRGKQKIYGIIIGGGLCALAVDIILRRVGSPAPASAAVTTRTDAPTDAIADEKIDIPLLAATRFPVLTAPADVLGAERDPFALTPQTMLRLAPPAPVETKTTAEAPPSSPRVQFEDSRVLSAVMRNGDSWIAIIDGVAMEPGQVVDGCVLREVRERSAWFVCPDGEAVLTLNDLVITDK